MVTVKDLDLNRAMKVGDEIAVWIKKNTGYKEPNIGKEYPIVSTEEVAEQFGLSKDEAREKLTESEYVHSKEVEGITIWY